MDTQLQKADGTSVFSVHMTGMPFYFTIMAYGILSGIIDLLNLHQHSLKDSAGEWRWGRRLVKGLGYGYLFIVILLSS